MRGVVGTVFTYREWACVACAFGLGCAPEEISHGAVEPSFPITASGLSDDATSATSGAFIGTSSSGFGASPEGNFPEPSTTLCGALPDGVTPMTNLESGWAVLALPGATDADEQAVEPGSARLRLADHALFDCAHDFFRTCILEDDCQWGLGLTLAPAELAPGVYDLAALADPRYEVAVGNASDGIARPAAGTLEIFRVTPSCIVGELRDAPVVAGEPPPVGGFIAQICDRQCVPSPGRGC